MRRDRALNAAFHLGPQAAELAPTIAATLPDPDAGLAGTTLAAIGPEGRRLLLAHASDTNLHTQVHCAYGLAFIAATNQAALATLKDITRVFPGIPGELSPSQLIHIASLFIQEPRVSMDWLSEHINSSDPAAASVAWNRLASAVSDLSDGPPGPDSYESILIPAVNLITNSASRPTAIANNGMSVVRVLSGYTNRADIVVPALAKGVESPDKDLSLECAYTLGEFGRLARSAVPAIEKAWLEPGGRHFQYMQSRNLMSEMTEVLRSIDPEWTPPR